MFAATLLKTRFLPLVTVTGLTAIVLLGGGCPVAQQPTIPAEEQEQLEPPVTPEPDGNFHRPIPPPDVDGGDDQDDSGGGDIAGGGGGTARKHRRHAGDLSDLVYRIDNGAGGGAAGER